MCDVIYFLPCPHLIQVFLHGQASFRSGPRLSGHFLIFPIFGKNREGCLGPRFLSFSRGLRRVSNGFHVEPPWILPDDRSGKGKGKGAAKAAKAPEAKRTLPSLQRDPKDRDPSER